MVGDDGGDGDGNGDGVDGDSDGDGDDDDGGDGDDDYGADGDCDDDDGGDGGDYGNGDGDDGDGVHARSCTRGLHFTKESWRSGCTCTFMEKGKRSARKCVFLHLNAPFLLQGL